MDDRLRAAWAIAVTVAVGGAWLLFVAGPTLETVLVAIVAFAATFLVLDVPALVARRRPPGRR